MRHHNHTEDLQINHLTDYRQDDDPRDHQDAQHPQTQRSSSEGLPVDWGLVLMVSCRNRDHEAAPC